MALPADRINQFTNPRFTGGSAGVPAQCTAYGTGTATGTRSVSGVIQTQSTTSLTTTGRYGTTITLTIPATTAAITISLPYTFSGAAGTLARLYVDVLDAGSVNRGNGTVSGTTSGTLSVTITPSAAVTSILMYWWIENTTGVTVTTTLTGTFQKPLVELGTATVGTYYDGSMPVDANYRYFWTGTADASTSHAEYRGVWVEAVVGSGCPKVQVTASGLGTVAGNVIITRTADGETWTVPGWMNRSVIDTDTDTDFAPPLGRTVSYTLYFNGQQINSMSLTVTSATGWVQDPYDPTTAMPVNTMFTDRTILTLAKGSLDSRTHVSNASRANVMGAKRPYSISGQRMLDGGAVITLNAWQNTASDSFKALAAAPILLFRGLPSWGSLPGLAYLDGPVQENAVDRYRKPGNNNALTQWTVSGDLIQPVSRKPLTGQVTNAQVQTNLNGVTNATIAGRSGTKRNIDVKANPLAL